MNGRSVPHPILSSCRSKRDYKGKRQKEKVSQKELKEKGKGYADSMLYNV